MPGTRRRGQPLAMLVALLAGWVGLRCVLWEPLVTPPARAIEASPRPALRLAEPTLPAAFMAPDRPQPALGGWPMSASPRLVHRPPAGADLPASHPGARPRAAHPAPSSPASAAAAAPLAQPFALSPPAPPTFERLPVGAPGQSLARLAQSRWSGDGWLLWRRGSSGIVPAAGQAGYGGSQAGAVLRYALAPASGHAPAAYARVSRALSFDDAEAALGVSARPLAHVPLRLLAEARLRGTGGGFQARPAASLITELPPQKLPFGAQAELYAQAGYVAGNQGTAFVDAQLTAERSLVQAGPLAVRLGGGAWAGGQEGATRLDVGPRATMLLALGPAPSRLALDWRFRVAGNAVPASGPALTFSAGF